MKCLPLLIVLLIANACAAAEPSITWQSAATGAPISGTVIVPEQSRSGPLPTIIYLKNLSVERIGTEPDEPILADLVKAGHLVLVLDYAKHPKAVSPDLNADVLKLRTDIGDAKKKSLLTDYKIDVDHLFILVEGNRLKRDVEFARDESKPDKPRILAMDVQYPSKPKRPVPMLIEYTCDNANRMGNNSLLFCRDTLLDGAQAAGFAVAMADHPVAPPYKGLDDPMPECVDRAKGAVTKLRSLAGELGTSEKIGAIGFSRGGPFAAILACTGDVQAALVHGNRYDYLDLLPNDPMLARFEKAWGKRDENKDKWAAHSAVTYLPKDASKIAPMFLNTSDAESAEYRDGLAKFDARLKQLGVEHVYQVDQDGRGHRVTTEPTTLAAIYAFFRKHLGE